MGTVEEAILSLYREKMKDLEHRWVNALRQLEDDHVNWRPNDVSNSIANLVVHVIGSLRQRFYSGMGNQPDDRKRDEEFNTREQFRCKELIDMLEEQFGIVHRTLQDMTSCNLTGVYTIKDSEEAALDIIFGAVTHVSEHLGQTLYIAKMLLGEQYNIQWAPHRRK